MIIPAGKQVRIFKNGSSIVGNIPLIIEDDVTINVSSSFGALVENPGNDIINAIGALSRDFTGIGFSSQLKAQGFQIWKSTEPLSMNFNFKFYIGIKNYYNAEIEVYKPMINLMSVPTPSLDPTFNQVLIPPGPSIASVLLPNTKAARGHKISVEIGRLLRIPNAIITKAEATWSKEVDDKGFPISGIINIDIQSINIATVEMLTNADNSNRETSFGEFLQRYLNGE